MWRVFFGHVLTAKRLGKWLVRSFDDRFAYVIRGNADRIRSPIVPGHEIIGHVAALGDGVTGWKAGDRIGGAWQGGYDGEYYNCR